MINCYFLALVFVQIVNRFEVHNGMSCLSSVARSGDIKTTALFKAYVTSNICVQKLQWLTVIK